MPSARVRRNIPLSDCIGWVWCSTMPSVALDGAEERRPKRCPGRGGHAEAFAEFARKAERNAVSVHEKNRPTYWPTGQEVNRQPRALLSVLLLGLIAFTGWRWWSGQQPPADSGTEIVFSDVTTRGGVLTSSLRSEPRSFNRWVERNFPTEFTSQLTQSTLIRINRATQEIEPALAESWIASPDNRTFTLTLREAAWSDGAPFTSADVLFTFQAIYDPKVNSILAGSLKVNGQPLTVTAPDARTVVIGYPGVFGPGIALLDNLTLAPKHKLEAALAAGTFSQAWGVASPVNEMVSLGPFVLSRYEPGQRLVFDRNPRYWKKDSASVALPYLDQIVAEVVPDQNAELVRLQAGQIDMLQQQVRPEDIATLRPLVDQGKLQLLELGVGTDPDVFFFNLRQPYWAKDPRGGWITRREFRQAISHAVDRESFANTVYLGAGVPIWGPITPGNQKWFSPNVPRYAFSLERAKALLAGLGLANRDADEWLEDDKGTEARFTVLTYRGNSSLERSAAVLRDDLRPLGIAVDVVALEQGALVERMLKGDFESIFFVYSASALDPGMSPDLWLSSGSAHIWNIGQATPATEWEKQIDDLMRQMMSSVDQAERKRLFDQVQNIFAENLPALYFVAPRMYIGVSSRVGSLTPAILRPQLLWAADRITVRSPGTGQGGR
ncbi:MAG: ABC transporter substrate-binding protein [Acidobacteria bacterium]|nr:ABC transporter substrate-binding protein [Acidobacteriota bacterium]